MKNHKRDFGNISINELEMSIENCDDLNDSQKRLARTRILFAREFLSEGYSLQQFVRPGKLVIVDLRNEMLDKEEAMRILDSFVKQI